MLFFNTIRFHCNIPIPDAEMRLMGLPDKCIHLLSSFGMTLFYGVSLSVLATRFTTGCFYPLITDAESFKASGLRIITDDPAVLNLFEENQLPRSLKDKVTIVDIKTLKDSFKSLNDSVAYVAKSTTWAGAQMYQERLTRPRLWIADDKLCSRPRSLNIPIYPHSPMMKIFPDFYMRIFESGLMQKWYRSGYRKYRTLTGILTLPTDPEIYSPVTLYLYKNVIWIYVCGMGMATLTFVIELLYNRFWPMNN